MQETEKANVLQMAASNQEKLSPVLQTGTPPALTLTSQQKPALQKPVTPQIALTVVLSLSGDVKAHAWQGNERQVHEYRRI